MTDVEKYAEEADVIVNGFAFSKTENGARIINLNRPDHVTVVLRSGEVIETSMEDIELHIACGYLEKSWKYMEGDDAEIL